MVVTKILHVEDDPDIQAVAKIALEVMGGFQVHQCLCGQDALDAVEDFRPDLLLLDAMMPGMSGVETLAALREKCPSHATPAIFMTAKAQKDEVSEFLDQGALGVITKPFDPLTLADQIREICA